jgi:signal transduction histidine kinase
MCRAARTRIVTAVDAPRVRLVDVAVAALVSAVLVVAMSAIEADADTRTYDAFAAALTAVAGGVLALHRRAPLVVLAVTTAALTVYSLREYVGGPVYLTWIAAIFAVSVARGPERAWIPAAASTMVIVATAFHGPRKVGENLEASTVVAMLFVSWAVGALLLAGSVRGRHAERAALEERARRLAETREEEARRRVTEERLRIARDIHDSVAHSLASISVQAGVGAHVLAERPDDARDALRAVKRASGDALSELRATLSMLRSGEGAGDGAPGSGSGSESRRPAAGLDLLPSLVESSRTAGLPVEVVVSGDARPLPPAVDAAAFRIVQESLTNVIRHAGAATATVAVRHREGGVEIEVTDDGRGATGGDSAGDGGGHGLAGMRERVALLGGELAAGPRSSGGFRVRATLPL